MNLNKDLPSLKQIDTLQYKNLTVPVWQVADPNAPFHQGPIICESDLPEDLAKAFFGGWQTGAACPAHHTAYMRDFVDCMSRRGHGWYGDWSAVVAKYVLRPSEALELYRQEIRDAVKHYHLANPRVTGAVLRGQDSLNLDLLVDATSPTNVTDIPELQAYLSKLIGVPVILEVPYSMPKMACATALAEAKPV